MRRATFENVRVGDMLRTFHFTGARRKKHYLYHVVRWKGYRPTSSTRGYFPPKNTRM